MKDYGEAQVDFAAEKLHKRVMKLTEGGGVQVVLDTVGGDLFQEALECVAPGGRICTLGFSSGKAPTVGVADLIRLQVIEIISSVQWRTEELMEWARFSKFPVW